MLRLSKATAEKCFNYIPVIDTLKSNDPMIYSIKIQELGRLNELIFNELTENIPDNKLTKSPQNPPTVSNRMEYVFWNEFGQFPPPTERVLSANLKTFNTLRNAIVHSDPKTRELFEVHQMDYLNSVKTLAESIYYFSKQDIPNSVSVIYNREGFTMQERETLDGDNTSPTSWQPSDITPEESGPSGGKKDTTKYILNDGSEKYAKNRLVLAVIKDYVKKHPNCSIDELETVFPKKLQGSMGVINEYGNAKKNFNPGKRYFIKEPIAIKDGKRIVVCTQWGAGIIGNIEKFIKTARKLGYKIDEVKSANLHKITTATTPSRYTGALNTNKDAFKKYLKDKGRKGPTVNSYVNSIDKISEHYREHEQVSQEYNIYNETDIIIIQNLCHYYSSRGKHEKFGNTSHGLYKAALNNYLKFLQYRDPGHQ